MRLKERLARWRLRRISIKFMPTIISYIDEQRLAVAMAQEVIEVDPDAVQRQMLEAEVDRRKPELFRNQVWSVTPRAWMTWPGEPDSPFQLLQRRMR